MRKVIKKIAIYISTSKLNNKALSRKDWSLKSTQKRTSFSSISMDLMGSSIITISKNILKYSTLLLKKWRISRARRKIRLGKNNSKRKWTKVADQISRNSTKTINRFFWHLERPNSTLCRVQKPLLTIKWPNFTLKVQKGNLTSR